MDFITLLCLDECPTLEFRKATLEPQEYCVTLASSGYAAVRTSEETSVVWFTGIQTGGHRRGRNSRWHQATVSQYTKHPPIGLLSNAEANPTDGR